ncbi:hypothetical protein EDD86DRAFT_223489 [Gorgonomyces haynaldii]|nr:hypothetical protein EDD86DRAFT_223489 [Gorgonomyces haynaldii]
MSHFHVQTEPLLTAGQVNDKVSQIHNAVKGFGSDKSGLIHALGGLTEPQMQQVTLGYKAAYGETLVDRLKKELSGDLERLFVSLVEPLANLDARRVNKCIAGLGTNEIGLVEVLAGRTSTEIANLKRAYKEIFNKDIEKHIDADVSGHEQQLFIGLIQGSKSDDPTGLSLDADVQALYDAGEGKWGTDKAQFIRFFNTRSDRLLRHAFIAYEQKHGKSMEKVIKKEFSGKLETLLVHLTRVAMDPYTYFAELFESSMSGIGTNEELLNYLVARFREPTLVGAIKEAYQKKYGKSLIDRVKKETSGSYEKLLVTVLERGQVQKANAPPPNMYVQVPPHPSHMINPVVPQQPPQPVHDPNVPVKHAGQKLLIDQQIFSPNKQFRLLVQGDGNVVLYNAHGQPLWATGTHGKPGPFEFFMQLDGNLVLYGAGQPLWASNTFNKGQPPYHLQIQDDGNLVVYGGTGPLWASNTVGGKQASLSG